MGQIEERAAVAEGACLLLDFPEIEYARSEASDECAMSIRERIGEASAAMEVTCKDPLVLDVQGSEEDLVDLQEAECERLLQEQVQDTLAFLEEVEAGAIDGIQNYFIWDTKLFPESYLM